MCMNVHMCVYCVYVHILCVHEYVNLHVCPCEYVTVCIYVFAYEYVCVSVWKLVTRVSLPHSFTLLMVLPAPPLPGICLKQPPRDSLNQDLVKLTVDSGGRPVSGTCHLVTYFLNSSLITCYILGGADLVHTISEWNLGLLNWATMMSFSACHSTDPWFQKMAPSRSWELWVHGWTNEWVSSGMGWHQTEHL